MKSIRIKFSVSNSQFSILNSHFKRGFTIIELLVVFSLVALLSGVGIVAFANYSHSQEVTQATNNFKLLLNEARFNALSVVKKTYDDSGEIAECGNNTLQGYEVDVVSLNSNSELRMYLLCTDLEPKLIKSKKLSNNVNLDPSTTCSQIRFDALTAMYSGEACTIVVTGYGITKTINLDQGGNVSIE